MSHTRPIPPPPDTQHAQFLAPASSSSPQAASTSVQTCTPQMDGEKDNDNDRAEGICSLSDAAIAAPTEPAASNLNSQYPSTTMPTPVPQTPQTGLTFLLVSGRRRTMNFDPEITIGRVKELVWNAWPSDWQDEQPPAPSYLRVIHLGKILQDEDTLTKLSFPTSLPDANTPTPPTIVHLSIRPYAPSTNDDAALKKKRPRRGAREAMTTGAPAVSEPEDDVSGGCCCIVC